MEKKKYYIALKYNIKEDFIISTDEENDNVWGRGNEKDRVCMCARAHTRVKERIV